MRRSFIPIILLFAFAAPSLAAEGDESGFLERTFVDDAGAHRYTVYVPPADPEHDRRPVVLYLHGAGGRGHDGQRHLFDGLAPVIRHRGQFPAIVVFPQCENVTDPILQCWDAQSPDGVRALKILAEVEREFPVDPGRRVLAGWSMGGYGVWSLAAADPDHWSAVLPISGGGNADLAESLSGTRIWTIHGERDRAIPVERSQELVDAVREHGGAAEITVLPGVGHDAWKQAFLSRSVVDWMLGSEPPATDALLTGSAEVSAATLDSLDGPFEAALIVPRAVSLRLGRDALRTLAYGVPDVTPLNLLDGQLTPITCSMDLDGQPLEVRLDDLAYSLRLHRAIINPTASGTLELQLGLQPFEVTIGRASIAGGDYFAATRNVRIRIGHRRPVWITLTVKPTVEDHHLQFRILKSDFRIPDDNWLVLPPEDVEFRGPGLTADIIRSGVVGGLYVRRHDFEENVEAVIPELLQSIEDRLTPPVTGDFAANVWPLPVFQPRMQFLINDVAVDGDGISLALDIAVASFDPLFGTAPLDVVDPIGPPASEIPRSRDLTVRVAAEAIDEIAEMFVRTGVGRIDLRDLPEHEFAALADPEQLASLIPRIREYGPDAQVRSELVLSRAFHLESADADHSVSISRHGNSSGIRATLDVRRVSIVIDVRSSTTGGDWERFGTIEARVRQNAAIHLDRPSFSQRTLAFRWDGAPEIDAEFMDGEARHTEWNEGGLRDVIRDGWLAWTADADESLRTIPDIELGSTRLRLENVAWQGHQIVAGFQSPETRIVNATASPLTYEVRGPFSNWGGPHRLLPGEFDDYQSPYPLTIRFPDRRNTQPRWLPLGSLNAIESTAPDRSP